MTYLHHFLQIYENSDSYVVLFVILLYKNYMYTLFRLQHPTNSFEKKHEIYILLYKNVNNVLDFVICIRYSRF